MDNSRKYLRLSKEPNKIYIRSNFLNGIQIMLDEESKQYKEQQLKNEQTSNQNKKERNLSNGYIGIDKTPKEICDLVKKTIKGQDEAIKTIVTCLQTTINGRSQSRGLTATISKLFLEIIYEVANNPGKYKEVHLGKDIINNPNDYQLIENKIIKRTLNINNKTDKRYR